MGRRRPEHEALLRAHRDAALATLFNAEGAFDPGATRSALSALSAPTAVIVGAVDLVLPRSTASALVAMLRTHRFSVQPGAGHYPWIDDPGTFVELVRRALA